MSVLGADINDIHIWIDRRKLMFECRHSIFLEMRVKGI
jgi:hypothetical protein